MNECRAAVTVEYEDDYGSTRYHTKCCGNPVFREDMCPLHFRFAVQTLKHSIDYSLSKIKSDKRLLAKYKRLLKVLDNEQA